MASPPSTLNPSPSSSTPTASPVVGSAANTATLGSTALARHTNPVLAFIIGLSIILLASVLNAAGLNLTKLDHVRTKAIPKGLRRSDWARPLWLLGMLLYILSQLIGSTLALEYMRAEYVAPLGSTSLVFNFLFARFLVGTPVTSTDIYGTIIVVLGVIGIVAFGSINSGLASETDVAHLTYLWRRSGWLGFFFCMVGALCVVGTGVSRLDAVLNARGEDEMDIGSNDMGGSGLPTSLGAKARGPVRVFRMVRNAWGRLMAWVTEMMEVWTLTKDDKQIAWTLGIGWACLGGGLAGGCLVFAKATVKLLSGSLSHENPGNQFGHAAPIFTIIFLVLTAVLQITCLNRGLKVYDSTLVVPVFYGVYTATGFLDSLVFNDEVDSYKSWTLFLIFVSILVLISGVVLLTHKKPEATTQSPTTAAVPRRGRSKRLSTSRGEGRGLRGRGSEDGEDRDGDRDGILWAVGEASDEEDDDDSDEPLPHHNARRSSQNVRLGVLKDRGEESVGLMGMRETGASTGRARSVSRGGRKGNGAPSAALMAQDEVPFRDTPDSGDFGRWGT